MVLYSLLILNILISQRKLVYYLDSLNDILWGCTITLVCWHRETRWICLWKELFLQAQSQGFAQKNQGFSWERVSCRGGSGQAR